jgi:uncharacterized protein
MATHLGNGRAAKHREKIRILAVADVVEPQIYNDAIKNWLGEVDLLVSCGDLPPHYLDFLITTLRAPMVHVLGNHCHVPHDSTNLRCDDECYPGALNIDGKIADFNGLIIAGLEGSPVYNMGPHQYSEQQVAWKLLRMAPALLREKVHAGRYLDLLVTHAPPRGLHDNPDVAHKGFESLLVFIEKFKPAVLLHGHTHRYDPMLPTHTRHGSTDIINVYGHRLLELVWDPQKAAWRMSLARSEVASE